MLSADHADLPAVAISAEAARRHHLDSDFRLFIRRGGIVVHPHVAFAGTLPHRSATNITRSRKILQ
jgi:hypothetical protein